MPDQPESSFCIGSARIGPTEPTFVIAEAGVNHNGDLRLALEMVEAAAQAGADAVKFQAFSADRLATARAPAAEYQQAPSQREILRGLELKHGQFAAIAAACAAAGIEMLATPFGPEDLAMLVALGLRAVKVASPDLTNVPLLEAVRATRRPTIVSTGAATLAEVAVAVRFLRAGHGGPLALLHCVSSYPTPLASANLQCIGTLAQEFGLPVGFSDHTTEIVAAALAVSAGACILEKHFTLDRTLPGPDQAISLEPDELAKYVSLARQTRPGQLDPAALGPAERSALGDGVKQPQPIEADVRLVARSSVTSAVDIPAGARIERSMLTIKRPGGGIEPAALDSVLGRSARADIPADTTLMPDMLL